MHVERTQWGIVVGEKYLTTQEALDLLQWLSRQRDTLLLMRQEAEVRFSHPTAEHPHEAKMEVPQTSSPHQEEWTPAELQEMISEDEQIANIEL